MSGHSKWATIHRQKAIVDQKRGQIFTKLGRAITIAVREGGGVTDPTANFHLKMAIEKARAANMPKENVQRAIKRGSGEMGEEKWEEVTYEGYGPGQVGIIVECLTDNRQRTGQVIKNIFETSGGSLAGPGAVSFQFEKSGFLTVKKPANVQETILKIMDIEGVMDVEEVSDAIEVHTRPDKLEKVKEGLEGLGLKVTSGELTLKPRLTVLIRDSQKAQKILEFMEKLEDLDEVQKVYPNFDIKDELLKETI